VASWQALCYKVKVKVTTMLNTKLSFVHIKTMTTSFFNNQLFIGQGFNYGQKVSFRA
jgi:hypothetical protein